MDSWYFGIDEARTHRAHESVELAYLRMRVQELEEENKRLRGLVMSTIDKLLKALL